MTSALTQKRSWGITCPVFAALLAVGIVPEAAAQSTNAEILQRLATECLLPATQSYGRLTLRSDGRNPFLDQAVVSSLTDRAVKVFMETGVRPDTTVAPERMALLTYFVENASVRYERSGRRRVSRHISLDLGYIVLDSDGLVAADSTCSNSYADDIARSRLDVVESDSIPITLGERPRRGWLRRYAEPVVIGTATAVAVYLFFNVRSDANDSP